MTAARTNWKFESAGTVRIFITKFTNQMTKRQRLLTKFADVSCYFHS